MALRSSSFNNVAANNIVVTAPSGIVSGDVLIAYCITDNNSTTLHTPSGFTGFNGGAAIGSSFDAATFSAGYKVATGSEPGSYTFQNTGTQAVAGILCFRDVTVSGIQSTTRTNTGTASPWPIPANAITTTVACDLIWLGGSDVNGSTPATVHTAPSGYTLVQDVVSGFRAMASAVLENQSAGNTGTPQGTGTATGRSAFGMCHFIALPTTVSSGPTAAARARYRRLCGVQP